MGMKGEEFIAKFITMGSLRCFNIMLVLISVTALSLFFSVKLLNAMYSFMFGLSLMILFRTRKLKNEDLSISDKKRYFYQIMFSIILIGITPVIANYLM
ncbi:hypothetical protein [Bacillus cereus]|uniref:Membrane protein n=1 Tax=Bacillus cereus 03BB108 TaxID=451709 RepID=A0AAN0W4N3_BACCE|nr:hypothetical protein [Bacillus cereus]AJI08741.1 putative membrane protein [Bacillus cereus 03BB108]EDX60063.1 hypothetical protein BC03BB108_B0072 [Bacillus cereus 03BB108]QKG99230.1 hypothetical protein FOC96_02935 [Bacillus cereus]